MVGGGAGAVDDAAELRRALQVHDGRQRPQGGRLDVLAGTGEGHVRDRGGTPVSLMSNRCSVTSVRGYMATGDVTGKERVWDR